MDYDVLVVGSGIGGMESALKLGDMGYRVLVVEKEPSVGGRMVLLSKVFPTLDCASCIATPKMAATAHHPNVTVTTDSEVAGIARDGTGGFHVQVHRKPRFVDLSACTGCRQCEQACTVAVPDEWNGGMVSRRAAYIAFPQAIPQKALIERPGTSPCIDACPAGIKAHGYVSLIRSGLYEEAFQLVLEATPLVGTLGRACYAPCEAACTRGELEGPVAIRRLKRFVAERHYARRDSPDVTAPEPNGRSVAIVGSGPAGLTAAWQLARAGYAVRIFEAAPGAGWLPAPGDPRVPASGRGRRAGHRERHRARRGDLDGNADSRPGGAQGRWLRRGPGGDRNASSRRRWACRESDWTASSRASTSCATSTPGTRPTWRASGSWSSAAATSPWTPRGPRFGSARSRRWSPTAAAARRCPPTTPRWTTRVREGVRFMFQVAPVEVTGDDRRRRGRAALPAHGAGRARRVGAAPAGAGAGQRVRHRLRRRHCGGRHRACDGRVRRVARGGAWRSCPGRPSNAPGCRPLAVRRRRRGHRGRATSRARSARGGAPRS